MPSSWPASTPGSAAGRDDAHGQARTESVRSGKLWTVNPLMVPARYNFLYSSSRPALRAAAGGGRPWPAQHQSNAAEDGS